MPREAEGLCSGSYMEGAAARSSMDVFGYVVALYSNAVRRQQADNAFVVRLCL